MNRTRKALGTVRLELPPMFGAGVLLKTERDGSKTCRIHGTLIVARRGMGRRYNRAIWTLCPQCRPFSARRAQLKYEGLWL